MKKERMDELVRFAKGGFFSLKKVDIRSRPIFGGRAIKWGLIIAPVECGLSCAIRSRKGKYS